MRFSIKGVCLAVGLCAIGLVSSSVRANDLMQGSFTLQSATQWDKTMLPAGHYTFTMARTQSDTKILKIRGAKQSMNVLVVGDAWCPSACSKSWLSLGVRGDMPYVSSMNLMGYRENFSFDQNAAVRNQEMAKNAAAQPQSQQVAVQVEDNK